jgi:hypothetical protein
MANPEWKIVVIESPFAGDVAANKAYLQRCIRDCLARAESPYASHQMLTEALDDSVPEQRALGIGAGLAFRLLAPNRVFYIDRGWSRGMLAARKLYESELLPFEIRSLDGL